MHAVGGMTLTRQADAVTLAIVDAKIKKQTAVDIDLLRRFKEDEIGRHDFLEIKRPAIGFNHLLGHELMKDWLRQRLLGFSKEARAVGLPYPRGVLLVGPPGTGKSRFSEAIAH